MCSAVTTELFNRWDVEYKKLFEGGVSDLYLATHFKLGRKFWEAEREFFVSHNGKPMPQEHLDHLRVIANGLKEEIQAGKFDPKPEEQQLTQETGSS
jgi:hypothetical protein